jgi:hypothetical protein
LAVEEEQLKDNELANVVRNTKGRKSEREVVKIEDTLEEQPIKKGRNSDK